MNGNSDQSPKHISYPQRPFMLTSKTIKFTHKAFIPLHQPILANKPIARQTILRQPSERNGSQSEIKFELMNEQQMDARAQQLNPISIGERRRKKRHSLNSTAASTKHTTAYFCLPPPNQQMPFQRQLIIERSLEEGIAEQSHMTQQFLEEYSEEFVRLDREMKCKTPKIVNVEFAFKVKKNNSQQSRNMENLKRKHRSIQSRSIPVTLLDINPTDSEQTNQSIYSNHNNGIAYAQQTLQDFRQTEITPHSRTRFTTQLNRQQERVHSSLNRMQLSPINRFTNELTQYIHKKYLNIERLQPVNKTTNQIVLSYDKDNLSHQCQGLTIRNLVMQEQCEKNQRMQLTNLQAKLIYRQKQAREAKEQKEVIRTSNQDHRQLEKATEFTMTRRNFNKKDYFVFGMSDRAAGENTNTKVELYRDFLWKINYSNGLFVEPQVELERNYKVYVGRGNNSMLIKGLMKRRFWWTVVDKITYTGQEAVNFVFTQLKNNDYIKIQKPFNRLGNYPNSRMSNSSMTLNTTLQTSSDTECNTPCTSRGNEKQPTKKLKDHSQDSLQIAKKYNKHLKRTKQKPQTITKIIVKDPHQSLFGETDLMMWNAYFQKNRKLEEGMSDKVYARRALLLKNKNAFKIESSQMLRSHNHFNENYFIGNKKALFYSMRKYYELNDQNVFDFLPLTFHISRGVDDPEYTKFLKHYNQLQEQQQQQGQSRQIKNIWIVKPGEFTNRGTGITVCSSLDDVKLRLRGKQRNQNGKYRTFIVQKYLQRPFLYQRRKFDIRHYMLITCINGMFKGYWYEQGYIRTTSYEYHIKNCRDNLIHLTNDAIQKHTDAYGKFEKGNKLSYQDFQKYLDQNHRGLDFFGNILPRMKKICTDAIRASYLLMDPDRKTHNFEIFGMDFMIDEEFRPWLIEINTNPCLELCCPLLSKVIPAMVQNALKIGLDPLFPPPYNWPVNKKYQLGENPLESNQFELIFDESVEGEAIQQLYSNIDRVDKNMGDIEEEDEQFQDEGKQWNEDL